MIQLWQLYRLQQADLQIQELTRRKEGLDPGAEKLSALEELRAGAAAKSEELKKTQSAMKRMELELGSNEAHQKKLQDNLWSGKSSNPKELSSWQKELDQYKALQKKLEDGIIEKMELLESMEHSLREEAVSLEAAEKEFEELTAGFEEESAKLESELETAKQKREKLEESVEPADLKRYESLRSTKGGIAIVKIVKGNCGGCYRNLPEPSIKKAMARQLEFCNACGRILFAEGE